MATTTTDTKVIILDRTSWKVDATATLTPITPIEDLPPVYLVSVDDTATERYCPTMEAGQVIGGIVKVRSGWSVVAYTDRDEFFAGTVRHVGGYLPIGARNRAHAVRMLLAWWRVTNHPDGYDVEKQGNWYWRNA